MGFPPTSSKLSTDANNVTTFNYQFPNFTGSRSGVTTQFLVNTIAGGGTGQTTAPNAFNALNPMTTTGDMIYESATGVSARLPIGSPGNVLSVVSGVPTWSTFSPSFTGLTPNAPVIAATSSTITTTTTGTTGQVFTSAGASSPPGWQTLSGTTAFASFTSSAITTLGSLAVNSFTTFSNSPAFTITPTITGTYKVYCSIVGECDTAGQIGHYRVINTSGGATLLAESQGWAGTSAPLYGQVYVQSVYTLTAGTTYVFDLQGEASTSANIYLRGDQAPFYMFCEGVGLAGGSPGAGITRTVTSLSSNTTAGATALTDYVYLVSGTTTITLPTAAGNTNLYTIKNVDAVNTVSIATTSAQTIDGSASPITISSFTSLDLISNGSNWNIV